ncbi:MAG: hypothetical protein E7508_04285 [Ruminococcus sp.]|nr:hypothetical protein [Ruminococcus sp.]
MVKFLGVACIFFTSAALGIYFSENIKHKKERLLTERKMLVQIYELIRWNSLTLHEIARRLFESGDFNQLDYVSFLSQKCSELRSFPQAWEGAVKHDSKLSAEEKKLLLEIGAALGTTDKEGQLSTLEFYISRLDKMAQEEGERYRIKGKMYRSLGIASGAMIGILII